MTTTFACRRFESWMRNLPASSPSTAIGFSWTVAAASASVFAEVSLTGLSFAIDWVIPQAPKEIPIMRSLLVALAMTATSQAATVLSNLDSNDLNLNTAVTATQFLARAFQVGDAESEYSIDSVEVRLLAPSNSTSPMLLSIFNNATNRPGTELRQLTTVTNPTAAGVFTYTPSTPLTLNASTNYWIVATTTGAASYRWAQSDKADSTSLENWSFTGAAFSIDSGTVWNFSELDYFYTAINATAVPEPSSKSLLFVAGTLAYIGFWHRLRMRKTGQPNSA
jgi:hypothetical protein